MRKSAIYPLITLLISILSIIWMGKASLSTALFAGMGEALITMFIVIPIMAVTGSIYNGYKGFKLIYKIIYAILMAIVFATADFISYNISSILDTGEYIITMGIVHIAIISLLIYSVSYLGIALRYLVVKIKSKGDSKNEHDE